MTIAIPSLPWGALEHQFKLRPDYLPLWQRIAAGAAEFTPRETAQLILIEANYYFSVGMYGAALRVTQQAQEIGRTLGDAALIANARATASSSHVLLGNFAAARAAAYQALEADPNSFGAATAMIALALSDVYSAAFDEAQRWFERALALSRALNYDFAALRALHNLGLLYRDRGEFDLYVASSCEATELGRQFSGPAWPGAMAKFQAALIEGDRRAGRAALREYESLEPQGARVDGLIDTLRGMLHTDEEEFEAADQILQKVLMLSDQMGEPYFVHLVRCGLSRLRRLQGDAAAAADWARSALANAQRVHGRIWEVEARMELARAQWLTGDWIEAEAQVLSALDSAVPLGARYWAALGAFLLAALHFQQARATSDGLWLDAARRIRQGGYSFIYERERDLAFPLLAHFVKSADVESRQAAEQALAQLAKIPPLPLRITGLGRFEVYKGRQRIADRDWRQRKSGELFRFLLLQPHHVAAREVVCEALWPEQTPDGAQRLFHLATSTLRHILEPDLPDKFPSRYLAVEGEQVQLRLPSGSTLDVEQFERGLTRWLSAHSVPLPPEQLRSAAPPQASESEAELTRPLSLYTDDLFPPERYADWALAPRERLAELYLRGLLALAQLQLVLGQPHAALDACRGVLTRDPWREDAVEIGMRAHVRLGDRAGAMRLYLRPEQTLREEFSLAPRAALAALAASLIAP